MKLRIALLTVLSLTVSFSLHAMEPRPSENKLTELPPEMIHEIGHYLPMKDLLNLRAASQKMNAIVCGIKKLISLRGNTAYLRRKLGLITEQPSLFHMMIELSVNDTQDNINQFIQELANNPNLAYRIQYLNFYGNHLKALPAEIGRLTNLQILNLAYNQLTTLPAEIGQLTNLQELDLYKNQLTTLPKKIGQLTNLQKLYLSLNQLQTLPSEIGQLTNLQKLYLSLNQLQTLPSEIGQLTNLQKLYLSLNQLSEEEKDRIRGLLPDTNIDF